MIASPRGILTGLIAGLFAFLIMLVGAPNAILGVLSLAVGFVGAIVLSKWICRNGTERANALMVFAICYFASVYVPITAIKSNTPFYRWVVEHPGKQPADLWAPLLGKTIDLCSAMHYAGAIVLLGGAWLIGKLICGLHEVRNGDSNWNEQPSSRRLAIFDIVAGSVVALGGLPMAFETLSEPIQWAGYAGAGILMCVLFRSLRLQRSRLTREYSQPSQPQIPKTAAVICLVLLYASAGGIQLVDPSFAMEHFEFWLSVGALILLFPWLIFRLLARRALVQPRESKELDRFAVRFGLWTGIALLFMMSGHITTGIAESALNKSDDAAMPFSLCVIALKPLFCIFGLTGWSGWIGGFVIAALLPKRTEALDRIMASAKAGAVMSVPCILLVLHALNFALLFVPNIPVGHEVSANTVAWVGEGKWYKLAWMHSSATAAIIAGGAALWAAEASIVAGIIALVKRRHRSG